jgi:hypothetical protein
MIVATFSAKPAIPERARGNPSTVVAAFAGVPGMFNTMAVLLPPYIAPMYTHKSIGIAISGGKPKVSVVRIATPSVAVKPGRIPTKMPRSVDQDKWKSRTGLERVETIDSKKTFTVYMLQDPFHGRGSKKTWEKR